MATEDEIEQFARNYIAAQKVFQRKTERVASTRKGDVNPSYTTPVIGYSASQGPPVTPREMPYQRIRPTEQAAFRMPESPAAQLSARSSLSIGGFSSPVTQGEVARFGYAHNPAIDRAPTTSFSTQTRSAHPNQSNRTAGPVSVVDIAPWYRGGYNSGSTEGEDRHAQIMSQFSRGILTQRQMEQQKAQLYMGLDATFYAGTRMAAKPQKRMLGAVRNPTAEQAGAGAFSGGPATEAFPEKNAYISDPGERDQYYGAIKGALSSEVGFRQMKTKLARVTDRMVGSYFKPMADSQSAITRGQASARPTIQSDQTSALVPYFRQAGLALARNVAARGSSYQAYSTLDLVDMAESFGSRYGIERGTAVKDIRNTSTYLAGNFDLPSLVRMAAQHEVGGFETLKSAGGKIEDKVVDRFAEQVRSFQPMLQRGDGKNPVLGAPVGEEQGRQRLAEHIVTSMLAKGSLQDLFHDSKLKARAGQLQSTIGETVRRIEETRVAPSQGWFVTDEHRSMGSDDHRGDASETAGEAGVYDNGYTFSSLNTADRFNTHEEVRGAFSMLEGAMQQVSRGQTPIGAQSLRFVPMDGGVTAQRMGQDRAVEWSASLGAGASSQQFRQAGLLQSVIPQNLIGSFASDSALMRTMADVNEAPDWRSIKRTWNTGVDSIIARNEGLPRNERSFVPAKLTTRDAQKKSWQIASFLRNQSDAIDYAATGGDISEQEARYEFDRDQNADPSTANQEMGPAYTLADAYKNLGGFAPDPLSVALRQSSVLSSGIGFGRKEATLYQGRTRRDDVELGDIAEMLISARDVSAYRPTVKPSIKAAPTRDISGRNLEFLYEQGRTPAEILRQNSADADVFEQAQGLGQTMDDLVFSRLKSTVSGIASDASPADIQSALGVKSASIAQALYRAGRGALDYDTQAEDLRARSAAGDAEARQRLAGLSEYGHLRGALQAGFASAFEDRLDVQESDGTYSTPTRSPRAGRKPRTWRDADLGDLVPQDEAWRRDVELMARQGRSSRAIRAAIPEGMRREQMKAYRDLGAGTFADYQHGMQLLSAVSRSSDFSSFKGFLDSMGKDLNITTSLNSPQEMQEWLRGQANRSAAVVGLGNPVSAAADRSKNTRAFLGRLGLVLDPGNVTEKEVAGDRAGALSSFEGFKDDAITNSTLSLKDLATRYRQQADRYDRPEDPMVPVRILTERHGERTVMQSASHVRANLQGEIDTLVSGFRKHLDVGSEGESSHGAMFRGFLSRLSEDDFNIGAKDNAMIQKMKPLLQGTLYGAHISRLERLQDLRYQQMNLPTGDTYQDVMSRRMSEMAQSGDEEGAASIRQHLEEAQSAAAMYRGRANAADRVLSAFNDGDYMDQLSQFMTAGMSGIAQRIRGIPQENGQDGIYGRTQIRQGFQELLEKSTAEGALDRMTQLLDMHDEFRARPTRNQRFTETYTRKLADVLGASDTHIPAAFDASTSARMDSRGDFLFGVGVRRASSVDADAITDAVRVGVGPGMYSKEEKAVPYSSAGEFVRSFRARATEEQQAILDANPTELNIVNAGPGSGKTGTAAAYLGSLVAGGAENVLAMTFSRPGASELRDRLSGSWSTALKDVGVETFDAEAFHVWSEAMSEDERAAVVPGVSGFSTTAPKPLAASDDTDPDAASKIQRAMLGTVMSRLDSGEGARYRQAAERMFGSDVGGEIQKRIGSLVEGGQLGDEYLQRAGDFNKDLGGWVSYAESYYKTTSKKAYGDLPYNEIDDARDADHANIYLGMAMRDLHQEYASQGVADFDFMKSAATRLLTGNQRIRDKYNAATTQGLVDESNDTKGLEARFAAARFGGGFTALGDLGQNLGVDFRNTAVNFGQALRGAWQGVQGKDLTLTTSRRQGSAAIEAANAVLGMKNKGNPDFGAERAGTFSYTNYNPSTNLSEEIAGQLAVFKKMLEVDEKTGTSAIDLSKHSVGFFTPTKDARKEIRRQLGEMGINTLDTDDAWKPGSVHVGTIHGVKGKTYDVGFGIGFGRGRQNLSSGDADAMMPEEVQQLMAEGKANRGARRLLQKMFMGNVAVSRANTMIFSGSGQISPILRPAMDALKKIRGDRRKRSYSIDEALGSRASDTPADPRMIAMINEDRLRMAAQTGRQSALTTDTSRILPADMQLKKGADKFAEEIARRKVDDAPAALSLLAGRDPTSLRKVQMTMAEYQKVLSGDMSALPRTFALGARNEKQSSQFEVSITDPSLQLGGKEVKNLYTGTVLDFGLQKDQQTFGRLSDLSGQTGFSSRELAAQWAQQYDASVFTEGQVPSAYRSQRNTNQGINPDAMFLNQFSVAQRGAESEELAKLAAVSTGPIQRKNTAAIPDMPELRSTLVNRGGRKVSQQYLLSGDPNDPSNPWAGSMGQALKNPQYRTVDNPGKARVFSSREKYEAALKAGATGFDLAEEAWAQGNLTEKQQDIINQTDVSRRQMLTRSLAGNIAMGRATLGDTSLFSQVGTALGAGKNAAIYAPDADIATGLRTALTAAGVEAGGDTRLLGERADQKRGSAEAYSTLGMLSDTVRDQLNAGTNNNGLREAVVADSDYVLSVAGVSGGKYGNRADPFDITDAAAAQRGISQMLAQRQEEAAAQGRNLRLRVGGESGFDMIAGEAARQQGIPLEMMLPMNPDEFVQSSRMRVGDQEHLSRLIDYAKQTGGVYTASISKEKAEGEVVSSLSQLRQGRNAMLAANRGRLSDEMVTYWDGSGQSTAANAISQATTLGIPITNLREGGGTAAPGIAEGQMSQLLETAANSVRIGDSGPISNLRIAQEEAERRQLTRPSPAAAAEYVPPPAPPEVEQPPELPEPVRILTNGNDPDAEFIRKAGAMVPDIDKLAPGGIHLVSQEEALVEAQRRYGQDAKALRGWNDPSTGSIYVAKQGDDVTGRATMAETTLHEAGHLAVSQVLQKKPGKGLFNEVRESIFGGIRDQLRDENLPVEERRKLLESRVGRMSGVYEKESDITHEFLARSFAQGYGARDFEGDPRLYMQPNPKHRSLSLNEQSARKAFGFFNQLGRFASTWSPLWKDQKKEQSPPSIAGIPDRSGNAGFLARSAEDLVQHVEGLSPVAARDRSAMVAAGRPSVAPEPEFESYDPYRDGPGHEFDDIGFSYQQAPPEITGPMRPQPRNLVMGENQFREFITQAGASQSVTAFAGEAFLQGEDTLAMTSFGQRKQLGFEGLERNRMDDTFVAYGMAESDLNIPLAAELSRSVPTDHNANPGIGLTYDPRNAQLAASYGDQSLNWMVQQGDQQIPASEMLAQMGATPIEGAASKHARKTRAKAPGNRWVGADDELYGHATDEQKKIIDAATPGSRVAINADAGTGKTHTMMGAMARLLRQGVLPEQMSMVTFTNRGVSEFAQRIQRKFEPKLARELKEKMNIRTSSALASDIVRQSDAGAMSSILRTPGFDPKNFDILGSNSYYRAGRREVITGDQGWHPGDDVSMMWETLGSSYANLQQSSPESIEAIQAAAESQYRYGKFSHELPGVKMSRWLVGKSNELLQQGVFGHKYLEQLSQDPDATPVDRTVGELITKYQQTQFSRNKMGQEEMNLAALQGLENPANTGLLSSMQRSFGHLFVDEAQDLSPIQTRTLDMLSAGRGMTLAGDEKQGIYGWRGAVGKFIGQFSGIGQVLPLQQSWRSKQGILDVVNAVRGTSTSLPAERQATGQGGEVSYSFSPMQKGKRGQKSWDLENQLMSESVMKDILGNPELLKNLQAGEKDQVSILMPNNERVADIKKRLTPQLDQLGIKTRTIRSEDELRQEALERAGLTVEPEADTEEYQYFSNSFQKVKEEYDAQRGVDIGTIFAAKGGEAENVYLGGATGEGSGQIITHALSKALGAISDPKKAIQGILDPKTRRDAEERENLLYVGMTRAKNILRMFGSGIRQSRFTAAIASPDGRRGGAAAAGVGAGSDALPPAPNDNSPLRRLAAPSRITGDMDAATNDPLLGGTMPGIAPRTYTEERADKFLSKHDLDTQTAMIAQAEREVKRAATRPAGERFKMGIPQEGAEALYHQVAAEQGVSLGNIQFDSKKGERWGQVQQGAAQVDMPAPQGAPSPVKVDIVSVSDQASRAMAGDKESWNKLPADLQKVLSNSHDDLKQILAQMTPNQLIGVSQAIGNLGMNMSSGMRQQLAERLPYVTQAAHDQGVFTPVAQNLNAADYNATSGSFYHRPGSGGGGPSGPRGDFVTGGGGGGQENRGQSFGGQLFDRGRSLLQQAETIGRDAQRLYKEGVEASSDYAYRTTRAAQATGRTQPEVDAASRALRASVPGLALTDAADIQRYVPDQDQAEQIARFSQLTGIGAGEAAMQTQQIARAYGGMNAGQVANAVAGYRATGTFLDEAEMMRGAQLASSYGTEVDAQGLPINGPQRLAQAMAVTNVLAEAGVDVDQGTRHLFQNMAMPDVILASNMKKAQDAGMIAANPNVTQRELDMQFTNEPYWSWQQQQQSLLFQQKAAPFERAQMRAQSGLTAQGFSQIPTGVGAQPYRQAVMGASLSMLSNQEVDFRMQSDNLKFERENLGRQSKILDVQQKMQDRGIQMDRAQLGMSRLQLGQSYEQLGIRREEFGLQQRQNRLELRGDQLDLASLRVRSANAQEVADLEMTKATVGFQGRIRDLELRKRQLPLQMQQMDLNIESQGLNLEWERQGIEFKRWYDEQMYGTIGGDRSYRAYTAAEEGRANEQREGGYSSTGQASNYNQTQQRVAGTPVMGLQNEQFYAGITHQLAQQQYGRTAFRSEAAYSENVDYIKKQAEFYERRMAIEDKAREFSYRMQDEQLKISERQYEVQKQLLEIQKEMLENEIRDQEILIPVEQRLAEIDYAQQKVDIAQMPERLRIQEEQLGLKGEGMTLSERSAAIGIKQEEQRLAAQAGLLALQEANLNDQEQLTKLQQAADRASLAHQMEQLTYQEEMNRRQGDLLETTKKLEEIAYERAQKESEILDLIINSRDALMTRGIGTNNGQITNVVEFAQNIAAGVKLYQEDPNARGAIDPQQLRQMTSNWENPALRALITAAIEGRLEQETKESLAAAQQAMNTDPKAQSQIDALNKQLNDSGALDNAKLATLHEEMAINMGNAARATIDATLALEAFKGRLGEIVAPAMGPAGSFADIANTGGNILTGGAALLNMGQLLTGGGLGQFLGNSAMGLGKWALGGLTGWAGAMGLGAMVGQAGANQMGVQGNLGDVAGMFTNFWNMKPEERGAAMDQFGINIPASLAGTGAYVWNKWGSYFGGASPEEAEQRGREAYQQTVNDFMPNLEAWGNVADMATKGISSSIASVGDAFTNYFSGDASPGASEDKAPQFVKDVTKLGESATKFFQGIGSWFDDSQAWVGEELGEVQESITGSLSFIGTWWDDAKGWTDQKLGEVGEKTDSYLGDLGTWWDTQKSNAAEETSSLLNKSGQYFTDLGTWWDTQKTNADESGTKIAEAASTMFTAVSTFWTDQATAAGKEIEKVDKDIKAFFGGLGSWLGGALEGLEKFIKDKPFEKIADKFTAMLRPFTDFIASIDLMFRKLVEKINPILKTLGMEQIKYETPRATPAKTPNRTSAEDSTRPPGRAIGDRLVPENMMAMLHKGEAVLTVPEASAFRAGLESANVPSMEMRHMVNQLAGAEIFGRTGKAHQQFENAQREIQAPSPVTMTAPVISQGGGTTNTIQITQHLTGDVSESMARKLKEETLQVILDALKKVEDR